MGLNGCMQNGRCVQTYIVCINCISKCVSSHYGDHPGTARLPACNSGFRSPTMCTVYLNQFTLAKKGWDLISSTPPTPAPSLSIGLY